MGPVECRPVAQCIVARFNDNASTTLYRCASFAQA
jgi:hypothetical protein